ncbi:MAG: hypothetical protein OJF49_000258 [Ktedonobacterales bacterium]|jgi:hypothetical protein|nr:MAG: hypothetical protein OJF49_000258 [Ktedonobacterales bacterium]
MSNTHILYPTDVSDDEWAFVFADLTLVLVPDDAS